MLIIGKQMWNWLILQKTGSANASNSSSTTVLDSSKLTNNNSKPAAKRVAPTDNTQQTQISNHQIEGLQSIIQLDFYNIMFF